MTATLTSDRQRELAVIYNDTIAFEWDSGTDRFSAAAGLAALFGRERGTIVTRDLVAGVVHKGDAERLAKFWTMRQGRFNETFRIRLPSGGQRWISLRGRCQRDGARVRLEGVAADVSPLRFGIDRLALQDAALYESEQRFAALADAMPQMVWSTLPNGDHDYYNARWYEFTGVPEGSTDGEGWNGMFHADDQERAWEIWRHSLATGEPYEIEYRLRHRSGTYRWVLGRALPIRDTEGNIVRWMGTCTDIDEAKRQADYSELLSHELSHRIKNIFAIIQSLIGLSSRRFPESRAFAAVLKDRVAALGRAHDFARPHSARSRPQHGETTLHQLAREILVPYPALEEGRIRFSGEDPVIDDSSATPLALIFHELATNASKYGALSTPDGLVTIDTALSNGDCRVRWSETGGPVLDDAPTQMGFGTMLSTVSVEQHLDGRIEREWRPEGLEVTFVCKTRNLARAEPEEEEE
ncbi:sensor histidine kinase [Oceaniglobus roseus]|uniref:sensor histidine kinase n=1 Tax=Oceaniglobus roseus TaxID=1737570 RepID=UPI000C7F06FE|nr:PAS domain-containing protein [Kandeliimicrobium roseum]